MADGATHTTVDERDAEYRRCRNTDRLEGDDAFTTWSIFAAAALAGGRNADQAAKAADAMITQAKQRFT